MRKESCPICEVEEPMLVISRRGYRLYQNPAYFAGDSKTGYRDYAAMHKALAPHFRRRLRLLANCLGSCQAPGDSSGKNDRRVAIGDLRCDHTEGSHGTFSRPHRGALAVE